MMHGLGIDTGVDLEEVRFPRHQQVPFLISGTARECCRLHLL